MVRTTLKVITAVIILYIAVSINFYEGHSMSHTVCEAGILSLSGLNEAVPHANIKVYKRWNEEDISWRAWFRRGRLFIILFLIISFGIIFLSFINNRRLRGMVKKHFQELWEAEENYYRLLEIINDSVIILDTNEKKILTVNQKAANLTGYRREDLLDMDILSLTSEGGTEAINSFFSSLERENRIVSSTLDIVGRDNRQFKAAVKGRVIKGYNKSIILLTISKCD